ncbi:MAG: hypothetical protein K2J09_00040, partial [Muribaculaceae bacterium]|nr:hypothetical protein [Muribaculaceae bacterium]
RILIFQYTHFFSRNRVLWARFFLVRKTSRKKSDANHWERRRLAVGIRDAKLFDGTTTAGRRRPQPAAKKLLGPSGSIALRLGSLYYYYE